MLRDLDIIPWNVLNNKSNSYFKLDSIHLRHKNVLPLLKKNNLALQSLLSRQDYDLETFLSQYIPHFVYQELLIVSILQCTKLKRTENHYYRPNAYEIYNETKNFQPLILDSYYTNLINAVQKYKTQLYSDFDTNKNNSVNLTALHKSINKLINYILCNDANITSKLYMQSFSFQMFILYMNEYIEKYYTENKNDKLIKLYITSYYQHLNTQYNEAYQNILKEKGE
ncbi:hypothetical protein [Macrococcoides canis]|uniref:hypothetical protein n=1 Tax=Macrococcoides canis TaxID=1855823 RepID=UPI0010FC0EB1|nr:hypothetical protein [Macrococcus canis]QCT74183.1 hypothetical protein EST43_02575 [Macrococcus canis]